MKKIIIIPARLGSWRFPNKPLTKIFGLSVIEHVYKRALMCKINAKVVVAICDNKLKKFCVNKGLNFVETDPKHFTAVDRVGEAARILKNTSKNDVVINLQGDEPVMPPPVIDYVIGLLLNEPNCGCANPVEKIIDNSELENPHRIKAIISNKNRLLYLSRQLVPSKIFDIDKNALFLRQTCVMAFRGEFLQKFCKMERSNIEIVEGIDMLRLIQNDIPIATGISKYSTYPMDVPEDLKKIKKQLLKDKWYQQYSKFKP